MVKQFHQHSSSLQITIFIGGIYIGRSGCGFPFPHGWQLQAAPTRGPQGCPVEEPRRSTWRRRQSCWIQRKWRANIGKARPRGRFVVLLHELRNWRFGTWMDHDFPYIYIYYIYIYVYWEFHHPKWRTHIFQRGWNHQLVKLLGLDGKKKGWLTRPKNDD